MRYVIIGNSAAGIGAVEGIRRAEKEQSRETQSEITIVTSEKHHTYARPLISYLLLGKTTENGMKYRADDFYAKNNCTLLTETAAAVYADKKQVILANGKSLPYDKLLVAAGSAPLVPSMEGLDTVADKCTFMSLDDAHRLEVMLGQHASKRVLIIGAGLIGLKCAEGILARAASVTVVDLAPRILSSILDEDGARIVQSHLESKGVSFRLSGSVERFADYTAILNSGEEVGFDVLVLAVGVRPNTALLDGIVRIDKGILVNEKSETTMPDIYAAGDCTQSVDITNGQSKIMALLPNAYMQGECGGVNMAGGDMRFDKALPMNAISFFELHIMTAGNYNGNAYTEREGNRYKQLFYNENALNGYILIDTSAERTQGESVPAYEKAGIYTSLIRERTPLDTVDFALICEKPGLLAFTKEERDMRLGGATS